MGQKLLQGEYNYYTLTAEETKNYEEELKFLRTIAEAHLKAQKEVDF